MVYIVFELYVRSSVGSCVRREGLVLSIGILHKVECRILFVLNKSTIVVYVTTDPIWIPIYSPSTIISYVIKQTKS